MGNATTTQASRYEDALKSAKPERISQFLLGQGWQRQKEWRGKGYDWLTPEGENVLVPTDPTLRHFTTTLKNIFEMFVFDDMTFEDIIVQASEGPSDILRRRIDEPSTRSGSCTLAEAQSGLDALRQLLNASAKRCAMKSGFERKLASNYIDGCRAGQTEFGSYVLKVYTPIVVSGSSNERRTFGRQATLAAVENISFLAADDYSPEHPLPAEMDWQVAESVVKMKSAFGMWSQNSQISVRYMKTTEPAEALQTPVNDVVSFPLTSQVFDRASSIFETLRRAEMFERLTFTGHVTDLHKDAPGSKKLERRITVHTQLGGRDRGVTMRLTPSDYALAVACHDQDALVQVDAKIDKRWRVWTAPEYYSIAALEPTRNPTQPEMFTK